MKPLLFTYSYGGAVEVAGAGEIVMDDDATRWLNALTVAGCSAAAARWARARRRDVMAVE
jgi:hypothetical protein